MPDNPVCCPRPRGFRFASGACSKRDLRRPRRLTPSSRAHGRVSTPLAYDYYLEATEPEEVPGSTVAITVAPIG
jgi:hypothetical protein